MIISISKTMQRLPHFTKVVNSFRYITYSHQSLARKHAQEGKNPGSFADLQRNKMQQARRTVLFQSNSSCPKDVLKHCSRYGEVLNVFWYTQEDRPFYLVEYKSNLGVRNLLVNTEYFPNNSQINVQSRHLFYKSRVQNSNGSGLRIKDRRIHQEQTHNLTDQDLITANDIDSQIATIYTKQQMSDLGMRLRWFVTSNLEDSLRHILPQISIRPFGSSVSGFGSHNSDIDMVMEFDDVVQQKMRASDNTSYFITRVEWDNERENCRHILDAVGGIIRELLPKYSNVYRILNARVPIVKFHHLPTGLDCDMCMSNRSGIHMSEVLYALTRYDSRVCPFIFCIRLWARSNQVTNSSPGTWLSNFQLTLLTIHFLQTQNILPLLTPTQSKGSTTRPANPINTSLQSLSSKNNDSLSEILLQFFDYFANSVDFQSKAISLLDGILDKPDAEDDLYLENPIDRDLNAGKTVAMAELDKFKQCCKESYNILKSEYEQDSNKEWGIMKILRVEQNGEVVPKEGAFPVRDLPLRHGVITDQEDNDDETARVSVDKFL